ncbi:Aste57867_14509 [Aphanomyces stellatus]|uniref:Mitochondrial import inner membrane translocase subunit TIM50 n=1 Tax=Aphanomyces stellatus TaxID=120398 RepID=A0A485L1N6_9STRA|nr:hypothetical protein As57867_014455 [Aphanomyces stellatus]VFT91331.1 Aste57867_14509 [Aphanomyces stellatus]
MSTEKDDDVLGWIEEAWDAILRVFCLADPHGDAVVDAMLLKGQMPRRAPQPTTPRDVATVATEDPQRVFFLVDDHPIRSMEVHMGESINELHHLVLLIVKIDRGIDGREIRATPTGKFWLDGTHTALSAKLKANESLPHGHCQRIYEALQLQVASKDILLDGTWCAWVDKEFKSLVRLGSISQPHALQRKCLVLDLDRTLWYRSFTPFETADFAATLQMTHSRAKRVVYVSVRPGVRHLLRSLAPHYDIVVFTASDRKFTESLIDHIDPDRHIQCRLYRDSCSLLTETGGVVKDLTLFGRSMKNVVLVDDNPHVCGPHTANAWICSEYFGNKEDKELYHITTNLQRLRYVEDIRQHLTTLSTPPSLSDVLPPSKSVAA